METHFPVTMTLKRQHAGFLAAIVVTILLLGSTGIAAREPVPDAWTPLPSIQQEGLLAERIGLWREHRLWFMADSGYLLSGFEHRPGIHPWQGEHVGKWLHAATLACEETRDSRLSEALRETVDHLVASQEANGYLGTYVEANRFYAAPEKANWDVWSHRYNLYGLLTYEKYHPDARLVQSCERMGDLLIAAFGEGKADITRNGTRQGISSTTLLESLMMLYARTGEERFLRFAEHIVDCSEHASGLRLMDAMLKAEDVSGPGDGKAYQLMANLLGYLLLYQYTGEERYLTTAVNGWENIRTNHLYVTGGPWSRHMDYNGNRECFALAGDFSPEEADVETCSTTTWVQLNLHLLKLTGQARYAREAERAVFNALMAAQQGENGIEWCYYTRANESSRPYEEKITCCASSGPRALEMFSAFSVGTAPDGICLANLTPRSVILPENLGKAEIRITGHYPVGSRVGIQFEKAAGVPFVLEFREPADTRLDSVTINGITTRVEKNSRGFYYLRRAWETGDTVNLIFRYELAAHTVGPSDKEQWIAFTYGPWTMAQTVSEKETVSEPFLGRGLSPQSATALLEPVPDAEKGGPRFRIRGTPIVLGPYFEAGSKTSGPRTYFRL